MITESRVNNLLKAYIGQSESSHKCINRKHIIAVTDASIGADADLVAKAKQAMAKCAVCVAIFAGYESRRLGIGFAAIRNV